MNIEDKIEKYGDVLTVEELIELLAIERNSLYRMLKNKKIKSIRIGKNIRIPKQCVIEYLQTRN